MSASPTPTASPTPSPTPDRAARNEFTVTVERVIDGDTIEVRFQNGDTENVRLLGVDSPETSSEISPSEFEGIPDTEAGRSHLREWADHATDFATSRLETGEEIRLVIDENADRRGGFGRLLVYLYDDGDLFNRLLLEDGYARLYDTEFSKRSEFASAEEAAQNNDIGLWDFTEATPTQTATPASGDGNLEVVEIHEDATGNDHENENDEYVVFENTGGETLDLTGWSVEDDADHTYHFPDGFILDPGAQVTLYTGSGTDTETELYWGSDAAIWNNGGDTVYVYDETGDEVVSRSY